MGVDSAGAPVVDPTANVIALNEAATRRQDDLRILERELTDAKLDHIKEIAYLRSKYTIRLAEAESKRIDAIRAVDVNAVAVASERQSAAATVLANQVASSADALRTLVSTTAAAMAEQQRQQTAQITDRLTVVERSQYEGRGKELVMDPAMTRLIEKMESVLEFKTKIGGKEEVTTTIWGAVGIAIGFMISIAAIVFAMLK